MGHGAASVSPNTMALSHRQGVKLTRCMRPDSTPAAARPAPPSPNLLRQPPQQDASLAHDGAGLTLGVFDSGLGGLSVLQALRQQMPRAHWIYVADSGHAPYGERDGEFVSQRSLRIAQYLWGAGAHALVVACNTATAAAVKTLRAHAKERPVIGVEPGVKPAVALSRNKRVGVLATPGTLQSEKFRQLTKAHGRDAHLVLQACPGLAAQIERGHAHGSVLADMVERFAGPLREQDVDTVVLGCTHYPLIAGLWQQAFGPQVHLVDTATAVAAQTMRQTAAWAVTMPSGAPPGSPKPAMEVSLAPIQAQLLSTGDPETLSAMAQDWLGWTTAAQHLLLP